MQALQFLKSDELKSDVTNFMDAARQGGVKGVPVTVVQEKWAIEGTQKAECLTSVRQVYSSYT
jgi:predicted DsbA family dithiol-disulfide isomerase